MWMIRSNGGENAEEFLRQQIVGIGWKDAGSLAGLKTRDQIIRKVKEVWPDYKPMKAVMTGSQLDKIANVMKVGDSVISFDPSARVYHVGRIVGPYEFREDATHALANRRPVKWEGAIDRDDLSVPTKNSLGSTLTVFTVPELAEAEIEALLRGDKAAASEPDKFASNESEINTDNLLDDMRARAREFIKDKLVDLDWDEMQNLVAGLLRAMGYKTQVSPEGSDRGKDIIASPDGLGLEQPRIVVEVKHRAREQIGSPAIRSFLGGRHKDDRGLYVSTGGYSKDARYEADRASIPLTLMDLEGLVDLLVEYYEQLDLATRSLIPLTRIYWPS
jgi:restriction system protein